MYFKDLIVKRISEIKLKLCKYKKRIVTSLNTDQEKTLQQRTCKAFTIFLIVWPNPANPTPKHPLNQTSPATTGPRYQLQNKTIP